MRRRRRRRRRRGLERGCASRRRGWRQRAHPTKSPSVRRRTRRCLALQRTKGSRWASIAKGLQTNRTGLQICDHFRSLKGLWSYVYSYLLFQRRVLCISRAGLVPRFVRDGRKQQQQQRLFFFLQYIIIYRLGSSSLRSPLNARNPVLQAILPRMPLIPF
jgi:hypothetical protein